MIQYPTLIAELARRGIKKKEVAKSISISERALYNKLCGKTDFTWQEIQMIANTFFPGIDKDVLFSKSNDLFCGTKTMELRR